MTQAMKNTLVAAIAVILTSSTASADFVNKPLPTFDGGAFECSIVGHTADRDADPVYKINVRVMVNDSGEPTSFGVIHTTRSGATYDRSAQYNKDTSIWKTNDRMEWNWGGKRGDLIMIGKLYYNQNEGWMYSERIFENRREKYAMLSDCHAS